MDKEILKNSVKKQVKNNQYKVVDNQVHLVKEVHQVNRIYKVGIRLHKVNWVHMVRVVLKVKQHHGQINLILKRMQWESLNNKEVFGKRMIKVLI